MRYGRGVTPSVSRSEASSSQVSEIMKFTTFLVALASAGAVTIHKMENSDSAVTDSVGQATGFDGFGGFGGFRGFHQMNGFMNNAFGDLDGQFDSTGFNKGFSASSENRKFDAGYGPHFLEELDHDSFGSSLGSSNEQKQGHPAPAIQRLTIPSPHRSVPQYREPLPTSKHGLYSQLGQTTAGKKSYPTTKHKQLLSPYNVQPYQGHFTEAIPRGQVSGPVVSGYSGQAAGSPRSRTTKYTAKSVQQYPSVREQSVTLKYFAEKYKPDEGFTFGAEKFH